MIDRLEFELLRKEFNLQEEKRESVIILSREIIKLSKQIIYSLQREDIKSAGKKSSEIKKKVKKLKSFKSEESISKIALQEYVEAIAFLEFIKKGRIPTKRMLGVDAEIYLSGLCDLTGELVRKAINSAIKRKFNESIKIKNFVEDLYGGALSFDFRNSELRRKSDSIKYNLKKLSDLEYEIKTRLS